MDSFKPTSECVNALPEPLRDYIHHLEARCDPAGDVAQLTLIKDQNDQLAAQNKEYQDALTKIREYKRRSLFMHADNTVKFHNQIQDIAQAALDGDDPPNFKQPSQESSEHFNLIRKALEYGEHRRKCIAMVEMRGPTPITSKCNCGWQEFADKMNRSLRDG